MAKKAGSVRFLVKQFHRWTPESTELRVTWEGEAAADRWGLVTLEKVVVTKAGNRVSLAK